MSTSYLVLTNCTARKRGGWVPVKFTSGFLGADLADTARLWSSAISGHHPRVPAHSLYGGRSIADAKRVADHLQAPLYVASAGFGLIPADASVCSYDITPSGVDYGLQSVLAHYGASVTHWWDALCKGADISALLEANPKAVLLAALPANYLTMLSADFLRMPSSCLARVRVFTSRVGAAEVPAALASAVLPYDERLESIPGYAGTRADFPQRALRHFVESLRGHEMEQAPGRQAVEEALAKRFAPEPVSRTRADDEEIKRLIRGNWRAAEGRSSVLLRHLRDQVLVSCEQGRFARLWRQVRDELRAPTKESEIAA